MITMYLWANYVDYLNYYTLSYETSPVRIMLLILASILTIPLDILLLPLEIISIIIYCIKEKDNDWDRKSKKKIIRTNKSV